MIPARETGGDLYDYFRLDERRLFFLVGDVAGKGLSASIFMAVSKALYKSATLRAPDADIGELMSAANAEVSRDNPEMLFVTAFAGILDLDTGELDYCNAGHENPCLIHAADATVRRIEDGDGPPLCAMGDFAYRGARYAMRPGELLCVVTDGVTEARNPAGALYGSARVEAVLPGCAAQRRPRATWSRRCAPTSEPSSPARSRRTTSRSWRCAGAARHGRLSARAATRGTVGAQRTMISTRRLRGSATPSAVGTSQLALAASDGQDVLGRDAALDQPGADDFRALLRQRVVDLIAADRVGMPDDDDIGHRALRDFREHRIDDAALDSSVNSSLPSTK